MSEMEKPDYATLKWVKEGIDETIENAQSALQRFVDSNYQNLAEIRNFLGEIHQLAGTLRVVQVYGGGILVEEMERAAKDILEGKLQADNKLIETMMLGLVQLPQYLQRLEKGEPDIPLVLLPVLNDLRAARNIHSISEVALYAPNLNRLIEREPVIPGSGNPQIQQLVQRIRPHYLKALLVAYKDNDDPQGWHRILEIVRQINAVAGTLRLRRLMDAAEALITILMEKEFEADNEIKQIFSRLDALVFRPLIAQGEEETVKDFPIELLKQMLYFVARSRSESVIVQTVKRTADLANSFPDQIHKAAGEVQFGLDENVFRAVTQALLKDLLNVQEALDLYMRGDKDNITRLQGLSETLNKVADTLGILGRGLLRQKLLEVAERLGQAERGEVVLDDQQLMDIATTLVQVETGMGWTLEEESSLDEEIEYIKRKAAQETLLHVIQQASEEFNQIKDGVEKYLRHHIDSSRLAEVADQLHQLAGVFRVSDLRDIANLLDETEPVLRELSEGKKQLNQAQQGALVDILAGVEYYLEARLEGRKNLVKYIEYSQDALQKLKSESLAAQAEVHPEIIEINEQRQAKKKADNQEVFIDSTLIEDEEEQTMDEPKKESAQEDFIEEVMQSLQQDGQDKDLEQNIMQLADELSIEFNHIELDHGPETIDIDNIDTEIAAHEQFESPTEELQQFTHEINTVMEQFQAPAETIQAQEEEKIESPAVEVEEEIPEIQMDEIDPEIFDIFMEEAEEELKVISEQYPLWKQDPEHNEEALQTFRRSFHTLKGSGRMVGASIIGEFAWSIENLLNRVLEGSIPLSKQLFDLLDEATKAIGILVEAQAKGGTARVNVEKLQQLAFDLADNKIPVDPWVPSSGEKGDELLSTATADEPEEGEFADSQDSFLPVSSLLLADEDLSEIFKAESLAHLEVFNDFIEHCEQYQCQVNERIIRAVHTLSGSAHLAEVLPLAELAHEMESYCKHLHRLSQPCDAETMDLFREFSQKVQEILEAIENNREVSGWQELIEKIKRKDIELPEVVSELNPDQDSELSVVADREQIHYFLEQVGEIVAQVGDALPEWEQSLKQADLISQSLQEMGQKARSVGFIALADFTDALSQFFAASRSLSAEQLDAEKRASALHLIEEMENALDMLHLNGKLPDLTNQIQMARTLSQEIIQEETAEAEETIETYQDIEPESILNSDGWDHEQEEEALEEDQDNKPSAMSISVMEEMEQPVNVDPELIEIFLEEAGELTEKLEEHYGEWEKDIHAAETINAIMRILHTLKGNARFAGLTTLGDLSHAMESLFENLAHEVIEGDDSLIPLVRQGLDSLENSIEQLQTNGTIPSVKAITLALEAAASGKRWKLPKYKKKDSSALEPESIFNEEPSMMMDSQFSTDSELKLDQVEDNIIEFPTDLASARRRKRPPPLQDEAEKTNKGERVRVLADLLDRLVNYAGEVSIYRARLEQQNRTVQLNLQELNETITRLQRQVRELEVETEAHIRSRYEREMDEKYEDFDPLEMDRYSTLQQLSKALAETISDLSNIGATLDDETRDADTLLLQQSRVLNDLQDGLLRTRMVPFSRQASRLQRVVRQTAQNLNKKATLEVIGAERELDRSIQDKIMGPLEHLLRNAVAHGIEPPEKRKQLGKPEMGKVTLLLTREGNEIVLTVSDDGAGLDSEAIRRKAVANGLLDPDAEVTEEALYQFILKPGFTTATTVTQVAGRGVGMDAVLSEIKQLGGALEIESQRGRGSSFIIRLPFTLAISETLLVSTADEIFAIPHGSAEVIIRTSYQDLLDCYRGRSTGVVYNDHEYPVRYLGSLLGLAEPPELNEAIRWYPLLLVRTGEHRMAIHVDQLLGNYQIVVKSIGVQFRNISWFTGGTILADGKIALLLDVNALVRSEGMVKVKATAPKKEEAKAVTVMVVDDSVTVRKVTSRLLEKHNMKVITAKDGVDAITKLQDVHPDIMLLDIEMPRMDGFELARHIRNTEELAHIPLIMITSRTGQKHRTRALDIGVDRYLGKPYQEAELLESIYMLLGDRI